MYNFKVYHHNDMDGCMSAHIIRKYIENNFSDVIKPNDFQEKDYYVPFDMNGVQKEEFGRGFSGTICFVVDLSFTEKTYPQLLELCNKASMVVWIDHHKSSKDLLDSVDIMDFPKNLIAIVNTSLSATLLCYGISFVSPFKLIELAGIHPNVGTVEYHYDTGCLGTDTISIGLDGGNMIFHSHPIIDNEPNDACNNIELSCTKVISHRVPIGLMFIDDHDRWQNEMLNSDEFFLGMNSEVSSFIVSNSNLIDYNQLYSNILNPDFVKEKIADGAIIKKYLFNRYSRELKNKFIVTVTIDGTEYNICCMNSRGNSWVFQEDYNNYDAVCVFSYSGESKKWIHNIYSSNTDFDCAKFAEQYGGGGHKGAAGFISETPVFIHMEY